MLKFPYGISDFQKLITNNYFYVDRTTHIQQLEDVGEYLLFLRPSRFGKSLLLSMLSNYYDVAKADEFDRLFGHLIVGQNPTPKHNQYFVLNWDFSAISSQGNAPDIQRALYDYLNETMLTFALDYQDFLKTDIKINPNNAMASFQALLRALRHTPYKLYLLIDEYDNFANEIMMSEGALSPERYKALVQGEGCLKTLFKLVKWATKGEGVDRTFITGVSPVVMSDVTSGHNIAKNIYLYPMFNDLCGFWEAEIESLLQQIVTDCKLPPDTVQETLAMMRTFYNGYAFASKTKAALYNPTLALYFLEYFQSYCEYPDNVLDENMAMDRQKIRYISQLDHGEDIIVKALNEKDDDPLTIQKLAERFGVEDVVQAPKDRRFMVSLLYFFGMVTLTQKRTPLGGLCFKIPNLVARQLYVERIQNLLLPNFSAKEESQRVTELFYQTGNIAGVCQFIEQHYFQLFDNRDYRWTNELTIKTTFLTLLFNDTFYITDSETPLKRTYADLTMIVRPDMRQYELLDFLIEFKYIGLGESGLSKKTLQTMTQPELTALPLVKKKLADAKEQLPKYRQAMLDNYTQQLRLHVYIIVSIGFERLLWFKLN